MKVLINKCYGGFSISEEFLGHLKQLKLVDQEANTFCIDRDNQQIIDEAIKFGLEKANGWVAKLEIVEIPDGCNYRLGEYDGQEWIEQIYISLSVDDLRKGLSEEQLSLFSKGCDIKLLTN